MGVSEILRESTPVLLVMVVISVFSGAILGRMESSLEALPGLLALVPSVLALRGNISTSMASRLGTWVRFGLIKRNQVVGGLIREQIIASIVLGVILCFAAGVLAHFTSIWTGQESAGILVLSSIAIIAGTVSGVFMGGVAIATMRVSFRRGIDMDNIGGPVLMTASDFVTIACLFGTTHLLGVAS